MVPFFVKIVFYQIIILAFQSYGQTILAPTPCHADQFTENTGKKTIVLDPGHGGENHGTKGADGTLEKDLSLSLARMIGHNLQNQYNIRLTRNEDRDIPLADRTAQANHHKADLFISIHLGGAFEPDATGSFIMYYAPPEEKISNMSSKVPEISANQDIPPEEWQELQLDHVAASRKIAENLEFELRNKSTTIHPTVEGANLFVLCGATMPALLIEPFYLTHPDSEKHYQDRKNLKQLANYLAAGIIAALEKENY
jgi:N-acetylmuramoyl-L-alanine amidase